MKKYIKIIVLLLISNSYSLAQVTHSISYNTIIYNNYFVPPKELYGVKLYGIEQPAVSYKIEKRKKGIELYYNSPYKSYFKDLTPILVPVPNVITISSRNFGLNFTYKILNHKRIIITPITGFQLSFNKINYLIGFRNNGWQELIMDFTNEAVIGLNGGLCIKMPIYNSVFFNTNLRYTFSPTGKYHNQLFLWEVGIGYMFQNKKKK